MKKGSYHKMILPDSHLDIINTNKTTNIKMIVEEILEEEIQVGEIEKVMEEREDQAVKKMLM